MPTGKLNNESDLIRFIVKGDESAFKTLYEFYRNRVYSIAIKLTHSAPIAEEIVEDVFLKIWMRRAGLDDIQNFSAYLFTVTRNDVYRALKKIAINYNQIRLTDENHASQGNDTEDYIIVKEYSEVLQKAISRLPNQQKQVYTLMKEQGMKREEVANILHLSPETVKFHLSQAVKNVRSFCLFHLDLHIRSVIILFFFL